MKKEPKILIGDIETSPNLGLFWRAGFKQTISPESIIEERQIVCISWKWLHSDTVWSLDWGKEKSDRHILEEFIPEVEKADMVVAHHGDRFDWPWINGRCFYHGITPFPRVKTLDTRKEMNNSMYLNSNKLDYVNKYKGHEGKMKVDYDLWIRLMLNNTAKDRREMVEYCNQDIWKLEETYLDVRPYIRNSFNMATFHENPDICPKCGSDHVVKKGFRYTTVGKRQRYKCQDCKSSFVTGNSLVRCQGTYPR